MRSVFVIGDSISLHYGPYLATMLEGRYDRKRGEKQAMVDLDRPMGGNGGDSSRVLDFLTKEREHGVTNDILLLNCGLHDIKTVPGKVERKVPLERYQENLRQIAKVAVQMAKDVVWVRTTDAVESIHNKPGMSFYRFHEDVVRYNEVADEIVKVAGFPILDLYSFTRTFGHAAFCDHVHYTEEVRRQQAAFIAGFLDAQFRFLRS